MHLQTGKNGRTIHHNYYSKMKILVDNLIAAGNIITDDELTLYILRGLGLERDSIMVNATARTTIPTVEEVYSLLLTHESRRWKCRHW